MNKDQQRRIWLLAGYTQIAVSVLLAWLRAMHGDPDQRFADQWFAVPAIYTMFVLALSGLGALCMAAS